MQNVVEGNGWVFGEFSVVAAEEFLGVGWLVAADVAGFSGVVIIDIFIIISHVR